MSSTGWDVLSLAGRREDIEWSMDSICWEGNTGKHIDVRRKTVDWPSNYGAWQIGKGRGGLSGHGSPRKKQRGD